MSRVFYEKCGLLVNIRTVSFLADTHSDYNDYDLLVLYMENDSITLTNCFDASMTNKLVSQGFPLLVWVDL
jgi:hypothetical protein